MAQQVKRNKTIKTKQANIEAIVESVVSQNVPQDEKILLQMRVFKEKRMYSTSLQLFKKGMKMVNKQLLELQNEHKLKTKLTLTKARYYHHASAIFYELNKYLKAMSHATQAVHCCKSILGNSDIEMMRFKEVLALSYKELQQNDDALKYFEPIYYGLNSQIKTVKKEDDTFKELMVWKADIAYNIAMIYNTEKQFTKASKYAKECSVIRNIYAPNTAKQVLALILVSVIVSCPQIAEYKLALDNLENAKTVINNNEANDESHETKQNEGKKDNELKQYLPRIQRLSMTVLTECVRWSKVTNSDLDYYLKTGQRKKTTKKAK